MAPPESNSPELFRKLEPSNSTLVSPTPFKRIAIAPPLIALFSRNVELCILMIPPFVKLLTAMAPPLPTFDLLAKLFSK